MCQRTGTNCAGTGTSAAAYKAETNGDYHSDDVLAVGAVVTFESSLWTGFKEALPIDCHAVRVENTVELGTPDVNLCLQIWVNHGMCHPRTSAGTDYWVELKVQEAPKRRSTLFRCAHFTMEQRQWLTERTRAGGKAYLLLQVEQVGKESLPGSGKYLWIRGDIAAVWVDHCTLTELINKCEWHGNTLVDLVAWLQE